MLTAELDGELSVAVSLTDLQTIADPFRLTAQVRGIALARAHQLRDGGVPEARRLGRFGADQPPDMLPLEPATIPSS